MAAWLDAARGTAWLPSAYAEYELPLTEAAARLRVPLETMHRLLEAGLPSDGGASPRVDANDVFNLALDLGWHATWPVTAFRGALRWLRRPLSELAGERGWLCEFTAPPPPAGPVHVGRPAPDIYGGTWRPAGQPAAPSQYPGRWLLSPEQTVRGVATLRGRRSPVRSGVVRQLTRELLDSGHKWAKLPLALQSRPTLVSSLGYATCVSVSLLLTQRLRAAGFATRSRRGYLIAPVATGHSWVEVLDEDGEWKVIDPVLVLLYRRLGELEPAAEGCPELELANGLLVNRVLPTPLPADSPLAFDGDSAPVPVTTAFRSSDSVTLRHAGQDGGTSTAHLPKSQHGKEMAPG